MKSLKYQLNLGLMTSLSILIVSLWWIANASMSHITKNMMQTRLEHDGEALLASLEKSEDGSLHLKDLQVGHIYQRVFSGHYFLINSQSEQIRSHSLWDQTLKKFSLKPGESLVKITRGPEGQELLQWSSVFNHLQQSIQITVAEDTSPVLSAVSQFNFYFALFAFSILLVLLVIQRTIIQRSLSPLISIKKQLQELTEGRIEKLSNQVPSEILPLINEVNHLLVLLSKQLKRSRNATGNLAHSLKHPLNLLMQLAESNRTDLDPYVFDELLLNTDNIRRLIDSELKRAKLIGSVKPGQRFYPRNELPSTIDILKRIYHNKKLTIQYIIPDNLNYPADRNDMLELIGNLLDNACKWAKGLVRCEFICADGLTIIVEDDGKGCNQNLLSSLTERGVRIDESIVGSGLGLSIVKDIVELYHGTINFDHSVLGGLQVSVKLPNIVGS